MTRSPSCPQTEPREEREADPLPFYGECGRENSATSDTRTSSAATLCEGSIETPALGGSGSDGGRVRTLPPDLAEIEVWSGPPPDAVHSRGH
jgi:hypothetical protein